MGFGQGHTRIRCYSTVHRCYEITTLNHTFQTSLVVGLREIVVGTLHGLILPMDMWTSRGAQLATVSNIMCILVTSPVHVIFHSACD